MTTTEPTIPPAAVEAAPCGNATREHEHLGYDDLTGRYRLRVKLVTGGWLTVADDGSVCARDVEPTRPAYVPGTLDHTEPANTNKKGSQQ